MVGARHDECADGWRGDDGRIGLARQRGTIEFTQVSEEVVAVGLRQREDTAVRCGEGKVIGSRDDEMIHAGTDGAVGEDDGVVGAGLERDVLEAVGEPVHRAPGWLIEGRGDGRGEVGAVDGDGERGGGEAGGVANFHRTKAAGPAVDVGEGQRAAVAEDAVAEVDEGMAKRGFIVVDVVVGVVAHHLRSSGGQSQFGGQERAARDGEHVRQRPGALRRRGYQPL